jgi:hypothetical protein
MRYRRKNVRAQRLPETGLIMGAKIDNVTGLKHFPVLQKLWQSSGQKVEETNEFYKAAAPENGKRFS